MAGGRGFASLLALEYLSEEILMAFAYLGRMDDFHGGVTEELFCLGGSRVAAKYLLITPDAAGDARRSTVPGDHAHAFVVLSQLS